MIIYIFKCPICKRLDNLHGDYDWNRYIKGKIYKCPYGCKTAMFLFDKKIDNETNEYI